MRRQTLFIWAALGVLALADLVLCRRLGLSFYGWWRLALAAGVAAGVAAVYGLTGRSPALARAAHGTLAWLVFVNAGTILTYVAAAGGGVLRDTALAAFDRALGFDWTAWYVFLAPRTALRFLLWLGYLSLFPQIMLSIFWFSARGLDTRNSELLLANLAALLLTAALFRLVPALGHPEPGRVREIATLLALRADGPSSFDLAHLDGLISFPSYHTVLAVLLTWAHRRTRLWPGVAAVNAIMLLSIPTFGGHYLADMIAGAGVAGLAILATTAMRRAPAAPVPSPAAAVHRLLVRSRREA